MCTKRIYRYPVRSVAIGKDSTGYFVCIKTEDGVAQWLVRNSERVYDTSEDKSFEEVVNNLFNCDYMDFIVCDHKH